MDSRIGASYRRDLDWNTDSNIALGGEASTVICQPVDALPRASIFAVVRPGMKRFLEIKPTQNQLRIPIAYYYDGARIVWNAPDDNAFNSGEIPKHVSVLFAEYSDISSSQLELSVEILSGEEFVQQCR